jgi:hypothetical protein
MKGKITLCIVLTMVALLGCLGMAEAQEIESVAFTADEVTPYVVPGWYYAHLAYCSVYFDGFTTWFYFFALEGGYLYTTHLASQNLLSPACQTGNKIAFYVFNTSGNWNQIYVYSFK